MNQEKNREYRKRYRKEHIEEKREYQKKYNPKNKEKINKYQRQYRKKHTEKVRMYHREYQKKYAQENKEKIAARKRKYIVEHPEKVKPYRQKYYQEHKVRAADLRLRRRFNISLEEADALLIKQQHKCPICKKSLTETKRCVDHDHKNGEVRGILCRTCNAGLGQFMDDAKLLENAAQYLKKQMTE